MMTEKLKRDLQLEIKKRRQREVNEVLKDSVRGSSQD